MSRRRCKKKDCRAKAKKVADPVVQVQKEEGCEEQQVIGAGNKEISEAGREGAKKVFERLGVGGQIRRTMWR